MACVLKFWNNQMSVREAKKSSPTSKYNTLIKGSSDIILCTYKSYNKKWSTKKRYHNINIYLLSLLSFIKYRYLHFLFRIESVI